MIANAPTSSATSILDIHKVLRRQEEPVFHELNGAIYISNWNEITPEHKFAFNPYAYVMEDSHSVDIDTLDDWKMAEMKYRLLQSR